jgi:hypothetical protein
MWLTRLATWVRLSSSHQSPSEVSAMTSAAPDDPTPSGTAEPIAPPEKTGHGNPGTPQSQFRQDDELPRVSSEPPELEDPDADVG